MAQNPIEIELRPHSPFFGGVSKSSTEETTRKEHVPIPIEDLRTLARGESIGESLTQQLTSKSIHGKAVFGFADANLRFENLSSARPSDSSKEKSGLRNVSHREISLYRTHGYGYDGYGCGYDSYSDKEGNECEFNEHLVWW